MKKNVKVLCINTAHNHAQISFYENGKIFKCTLEANAKSSENVLPAIEEVLLKAQTKICDIDVFGVVVGPGSFTGLRVGVSLIKGFCAVNTKAKVCAVSSLELMAQEFKKCSSEKHFCTVQNALGGRFFVKTYQETAVTEELLTRSLPNCFKVGLESENLPEMNDYVSPSVQTLTDFCVQQINAKNFVLPQNLTPVYLRLSQAEENLLKKEDCDAED